MLPVQQPAESPVIRAGTSSVLPPGSPPSCGSSFSLIQTNLCCGQRACSHFSVSLTRLGKALDSSDQVKQGRDSQSRFPIAGDLQTTLALLKDGSCPDLSSCGGFRIRLTLQTPSTVVATWRRAEVFKQLGPKMRSSKLCLPDDHSQRRMTSAEGTDFYAKVS